MPLLTSYALQDSAIHRLDPRTKVVWLAVMLVLAFSTWNLAFQLLLLVLIGAGSASARVDLRSYALAVRALLHMAVAVIILQILLVPVGDPLLRLGPLTVHQGSLYRGASISLRLSTMALLWLQMFTWIHPVDFGLMLGKLGLPYRYTLLVGMSLRFFPVLERELVKIIDAQAARGLELRGSLRKLVRLVYLTLPFVLRAIRRSSEVAMAMELRAFGYRRERTNMRSIRFGQVDALLSLAILAFAAAYFLWWRPFIG